MLCGDLNVRDIQKRGDTCICTAHSLCCIEETNTTLKTNYTKIKKKKKRLSGPSVGEKMEQLELSRGGGGVGL